MHSLAILLALSISASRALVFPSNMTARQHQTCIHCGTTSDATLSDCQVLVQPDTWNAAWAAGSNVCQSVVYVFFPRRTDAASVGRARPPVGCAYYSVYPGRDATFDQELMRQRAQSLLGCGDQAANKINGLEITRADRSGVCLSNGKGCGDCFVILPRPAIDTLLDEYNKCIFMSDGSTPIKEHHRVFVKKDFMWNTARQPTRVDSGAAGRLGSMWLCNVILPTAIWILDCDSRLVVKSKRS
ncbi:hypothetical protein DFH09DRAFT_1111136 [Mycena vulgaris]|nr:hypothetical protein DFH09DRAFT_1111136 [Mycena vulgaris]